MSTCLKLTYGHQAVVQGDNCKLEWSKHLDQQEPEVWSGRCEDTWGLDLLDLSWSR